MVRGEPIRMLLSHAKVKFEDKRISMEEWPSQKANMPNGQIPTLELKKCGTKLGQSNAILRMLGKEHGYYPEDIMKAYHCDQLIDAYLDIIGKIYKPFFLPKDKRADSYPNIFGKLLPDFLNYVEETAGKAEFLCGDEITIADFWIGGLYTNFIANPDVGFAKESW